MGLHESGNGVGGANSDASEYLSVNSTMFLRRNIHVYTWTSDGKTDHMFTHKKWHKAYLKYDLSENLTVILITVW